MHSHLDIEINNTPMTLPPDFSLSVTEENPLFHDVGMHSDPVSVPMYGNREIFQNVDDPMSVLRPVGLEHLPAKIIVGGLPMRSGTVVVQENEELKDAFAFNIDESKQSFEDLIGDLKCQDVPLFNDERIPVGEKICDVSVNVQASISVLIKFENVLRRPYVVKAKQISQSASFEPQALGFSYPGHAVAAAPRPGIGGNDTEITAGVPKTYPEGITLKTPTVLTSYINVTEPYESEDGTPTGWRYCNARVCYTHHNFDATKAENDTTNALGMTMTGTIGETTDDVVKVGENYGVNEDYGPYWVLDANRQQSGICFYVLYFLDCLFHHLGVAFDNSALMQIEDMRRLCFFTTKCKYMTDPTEELASLMTAYGTGGTDYDEINKWLDDRGCGGRIEFPDPEEKTLDTFPDSATGLRYTVGEADPEDEYNVVKSITATPFLTSTVAWAKVRTMYATSENFPEETVKTVLTSLENSFGIRFHYDYQLNKVTAYLLRDVFRDTDNIVTLPVTLLEANKLSEKITGVRMKYSAESDSYEQQQNVRRAKRDYDTDFDYIDYREGRTRVSTGYIGIASDLRTENVTCYVDKNTANGYRFKISKDVDSADIAYHRLFEVGQFHGIEVGDCSKINEDYVKELISDFQPMSFNDVNAYAEMKLGSTQPILAAYIDEDMEHEFVTQKINHPVYAGDIDLYATEVLRLIESYDPTSTDDGNSPLQDMDWGLAIAIMRGGGTDATIQNFDRGYDGFDNSKWRTTAGRYAMSSDTMDQFGNTFDYNGTPSDGSDNGDGGGERFSLKIRSYKPFLYYQDANGKTHVTSDMSLLGKPVEGVSGKTWLIPSDASKSVRLRGLADTFMAEYIHFLLERTALRLHCLATPAVMLDIPNHWHSRFRIGPYLGYIDKLSYDINAKTGLGEVTIDLFAI